MATIAPVVKKTNGKRNRAAGHKYETDTAKLFREIGFHHVVTSRSCNRARDNQKVDLCNSDELVQGRLPYNIQNKCETKPVAYGKLLEEMPSDGAAMNVVFHRQTAKTKAGIFKVRGEYAIMKQADFIALIRELESLRPFAAQHKQQRA